MAKLSLDKLGWKIVQVLDWYGRFSVNRIAKAVGSNKDVVAYRIRKLEEKGIITGYYPVLNMYKLGYNTVRLYFDLEEIDEQQEKDFVKFLDEELNSGLIFRMDYPYRYGIFLWVKSIYEIQKALEQIKKKLGKALIKYNQSLICTFRQFPKDYLFVKKHHYALRSLEPTTIVDYDEDDFKILKQLAKNARLSTVQMAKNLEIPQTTVSAKIKALEKKGIIQGYRADIDFIKLGFMNYFLEIYLDNNNEVSQIESWANINHNVVWLQKIIGTCDIEIEVELKGRVELESFLNELRKRFKSIRKIVFWSQEYKKLTYLPATSQGSKHKLIS